jgi:signal peptidase I
VPSLLIKDILMVEKATMGAKVPILNWKMPGFIKPQRNDVIVFVHPGWKSPGIGKELVSLLTLYLINLDNTFDSPKNLVKRLVGLPGDKIVMTNKTLYINNTVVKKDFLITANEAIYDRLVKVGYVSFDIYKESFEKKNRIVQHIYQDNHFNREEVYDFPEIYVPKKGDVIVLKGKNDYYKGLIKLLIERESGKLITRTPDGRFYIDGKEITEWKVSDNYYFGMGDNRDYSEDCRFFGFIPEKNIFGRPLFRYFPFTRLGFDVNESEAQAKKTTFYN